MEDFHITRCFEDFIDFFNLIKRLNFNGASIVNDIKNSILLLFLCTYSPLQSVYYTLNIYRIALLNQHANLSNF